MIEMKNVIPSVHLRRPHWGHSNRFREFLARFLPLKPNKFFDGQAFLLPDGTVIVDLETYRILQEHTRNAG